MLRRSLAIMSACTIVLAFTFGIEMEVITMTLISSMASAVEKYKLGANLPE